MKILAFACLAISFALTAPAGAQEKRPVPALSAVDRAHIIHDVFTVSYTTAAIPESVKQTFVRPGSKWVFRMAEPSQPFDATDVLTGLPTRRLVFCAVSNNECILHYESGGWGSRTSIDVFHLDGNNAKLIFSGLGSHIYQGMTDLRWDIWAHNRFATTPHFD